MKTTPSLTPSGLPVEPNWAEIYSDELDQVAARDAWSTVIREMRDASILAVANGHAIKRMVDFRVQYDRAARHVAESGPVLKAKRAKVGQWNPYFSVMNKASAEIRALEAELGISPTARSKAARVATRQRKLVPADEFLNPEKWAEAHPTRSKP